MKTLTNAQLERYREQLLRQEERAASTVEKYLHDLRRFAVWLSGRELTREAAVAWKAQLLRENKAPATVNAALSALNGLLTFLGRGECRVRFLKVQRSAFRDERRELTRREYDRLIQTAERQGKERLALVMETICACGIRVSETGYITVEAAMRGEAQVRLKGKSRTVLLPGKLCRKLLKYARRRGIARGPVFRTRQATALSRKQIWAEMKALCPAAGVERSKVFPHNLRHLFAAVYYRTYRDLVKLADILGHSSVNTTRIYLVTTGKEHQRQLEGLHLVS